MHDSKGSYGQHQNGDDHKRPTSKESYVLVLLDSWLKKEASRE